MSVIDALREESKRNHDMLKDMHSVLVAEFGDPRTNTLPRDQMWHLLMSKFPYALQSQVQMAILAYEASP